MNKAKTRDNVAATIQTSRGLGHRLALLGHWAFEAFGPVKISDPGKFLSILQDDLIVPKAHNVENIRKGFIHKSLADGILRNIPGLRRDLEPLLSGGGLLWADANHNRIVDVGLDEILDKFFKGSTYTASHFVGLTDSTPTTAAGDTMSSHAGWSEVTAYSEGVRQTYTPGTVASQSVDNSASKAQFSINGTTTVGGGFLTTDNTKGGTAGILVSVEAFTGGDKSLGNGDTLSVQATYTLSDV